MRAGSLRSSFPKEERPIVSVSTCPAATTSAERGDPSSNAISPKESPAPKRRVQSACGDDASGAIEDDEERGARVTGADDGGAGREAANAREFRDPP